MYQLSQLIGGFSTDEFINCTPKDEFVTRFQLMHYPQGGGHIQIHQHPCDAFMVTTINILSEKGVDYSVGGVYFYNSEGNKVHLDDELGFGDVVVSYAGLIHGVDHIDSEKNGTGTCHKGDGPFCLGMSLPISGVKSLKTRKPPSQAPIKFVYS